MKVILMLCTGGISSQMFLKSIAKAAEDEGFTAVIDYASVIYDHSALSKVSDADYLFLYGPATEITREAIDSSYVKIKTILISPQVRYLSASIKAITKETDIECLIVDPETFAELAGKECFQIIK